MSAILRTESRKLVRGSLVLAGVLTLLAIFMLAVFPAMAEEAELIEEAFPGHADGLFGFEELHTMEGFLGSYLYPLVWVVFVGLYFAYVAGGMIADDIHARRMDLTLSNPVSRESVVLQKFGALWAPLVVLNGGMYLVLAVGAWVLDEAVDPVVLALVHLLSVPYLLVCGAIGLLLSVAVERVESAQAGALGIVFVLWLVDGLSEMNPDLAWVGDLTPSRYVDPSAILIHEEFALGDALLLVVSMLVLLGVATVVFVRRDI